MYKGAISKADQLRRTNEKGNQSDPDNYYNSMLTVLYLRPAYYSLAGLYVQLGRDFEALEIYKEVIRLGLDQADTHYEIGLLFVKFGDKDSAENAFRTLVERAADQKHNGTRKELKKDAKILRKRILAM